MKWTAELAEALVNLRGNRDFDVVKKALEDHVMEEVKHCVEYEGSLHLRAAGAVKALQWWTKAVPDAPAQLDKFRSQPKGK